MQNRLVIKGIPSSVPCLPNAASSLRDLVEEHGCWVDRFTFLNNYYVDNNDEIVVAAAELHIENVRDRAVRLLNGLHVELDYKGDLIASYYGSGSYKRDHNDFITEEGRGKCVKFQIRAFPANAAQSSELVELCQSIDGELDDTAAQKVMEKQLLQLPGNIEVVVRCSRESGGTGSNPWRGGVILATQVCFWCNEESIKLIQKGESIHPFNINFGDLFENKKCLELGAGSAGLPSMALGMLCRQNGYSIDLISSDGVDEIVNALKTNVFENQLLNYVEVRHFDWNNLTTFCNGENGDKVEADTILFSDCVYNEEGARALYNAICSTLKKGGFVVGILPDFRVGLDLFEKLMEDNEFIPFAIPLIEKQSRSSLNIFKCSGGGGKNYRLLLWKDNRS